jgi:hypothetical protein
VVKPGEALVIRVPDWWGPAQVRVYQEYLDEMTGGEFEVLAVVGEEFAVIKQDAAGVLPPPRPAPVPVIWAIRVRLTSAGQRCRSLRPVKIGEIPRMHRGTGQDQLGPDCGHE